MQKGSKPNKSFLAWLQFPRASHPLREMEYSKGVIESGVQGPWINKIRKRKLTNPPQALKHSATDDLDLFTLKLNKPMDRIANLESCSHKFTLCLSCIATRIALLPMQRKRICARKVMI